MLILEDFFADIVVSNAFFRLWAAPVKRDYSPFSL